MDALLKVSWHRDMFPTFAYYWAPSVRNVGGPLSDKFENYCFSLVNKINISSISASRAVVLYLFLFVPDLCCSGWTVGGLTRSSELRFSPKV